MPILVIDDDQELLNSFLEIFNSYGIQAVGTSSAEEAIQLIGQNQYSLVLTDLNLGPTFQTDKILNLAKSKNPDQKCIIMSGDDTKFDKRISKTIKIFSDIKLIEKPFDMEEVVKIINFRDKTVPENVLN